MIDKENAHYSFMAEYYDVQAADNRPYMLLFFPHDNSVEIHDMRSRKIFLKRIKYPQLNLKQLFVGASITIYSRVFKILSLGDEATRKEFAKDEEMLIFIYGKLLDTAGNLISVIQQSGTRIKDIRMANPENDIVELGVSSQFICLYVCGSNFEVQAKGLQSSYPGVVTVIDSQQIYRLLPLIFNEKTTATLKNCAVCVIKPHAIGSSVAGQILQRIIDEGFIITALTAVTLSRPDAEDFLEIYKSVVPEYGRLVDHMSSAACWVLELRGTDVVQELRKVCGPHDPEVCAMLYPNSIRGLFGKDRALNAVHCTDLVEDGPLESELFFKLMLTKGRTTA